MVLGGPLYQFFLRSGLIKPPFGNLGWRMAVITVLAWLPLVPLSIFDRRFVGGVQVPFVYDFEVHIRLLFSLPLLVLAELVVHARMRAITGQFIERQIITENLRPAFNKVISSAIRLRNAMPAEIVILLLVFILGPWVWRETLALRSDTWYATVTSVGTSYTPAGRWYVFVTIPVFQFILLRWYYRMFIWFRFLFQVSRLDLNLVPTHPDRCCGLGFLGNIVLAFAPLLMAHSGLVTGFIANHILYAGTTLTDYKLELLALAVVLLAMVLAPLGVFTPRLLQSKLVGLRIYGRLASDYVTGFARKWEGEGSPQPELLGSADIQSLADLDSSFAIVREIRLVPFGKDTILQFLIVIALPLLPLVFTMFSLDELVKRLITILL